MEPKENVLSSSPPLPSSPALPAGRPYRHAAVRQSSMLRFAHNAASSSDPSEMELEPEPVSATDFTVGPLRITPRRARSYRPRSETYPFVESEPDPAEDLSRPLSSLAISPPQVALTGSGGQCNDMAPIVSAVSITPLEHNPGTSARGIPNMPSPSSSPCSPLPSPLIPVRTSSTDSQPTSARRSSSIEKHEDIATTSPSFPSSPPQISQQPVSATPHNGWGDWSSWFFEPPESPVTVFTSSPLPPAPPVPGQTEWSSSPPPIAEASSYNTHTPILPGSISNSHSDSQYTTAEEVSSNPILLSTPSPPPHNRTGNYRLFPSPSRASHGPGQQTELRPLRPLRGRGDFTPYNDSLPASTQPQTPAQLSRTPMFSTLGQPAYTAPPGRIRHAGRLQGNSAMSVFEDAESPTRRWNRLREDAERRRRLFLSGAGIEGGMERMVVGTGTGPVNTPRGSSEEAEEDGLRYDGVAEDQENSRDLRWVELVARLERLRRSEDEGTE